MRFPRKQVPLEGPYGIRTRAAAVRGRCPRPLDEWAVARASVANVPGPTGCAGASVGRARFPAVETLLEEPPQLLPAAEHITVAAAALRQLHDADVCAARTVATLVRGGLVERRGRRTAEETHLGHVSRGRVVRKRRYSKACKAGL